MRKATGYLLLFLLVLAGLIPTLVGAQGKGEVKGEEESNMVLRFPSGLTVPEEIKPNLPDWVKLEKDGTLPEEIVIPSHVKIPETVELPERMVKEPETQKDGSIVWKEYKAPAVTIRLAEAFKVLSKPRVLSSGQAYPNFVSVAPDWRHCYWNYANFNVPSNSWGFVGHSYLPTWTFTHGPVENWNFTSPQGPNTTLCISRSIWWMYIAPVPPPIQSQVWLAYVSPWNWWMDYNQ